MASSSAAANHHSSNTPAIQVETNGGSDHAMTAGEGKAVHSTYDEDGGSASTSLASTANPAYGKRKIDSNANSQTNLALEEELRKFVEESTRGIVLDCRGSPEPTGGDKKRPRIAAGRPLGAVATGRTGRMVIKSQTSSPPNEPDHTKLMAPSPYSAGKRSPRKSPVPALSQSATTASPRKSRPLSRNSSYSRAKSTQSAAAGGHFHSLDPLSWSGHQTLQDFWYPKNDEPGPGSYDLTPTKQHPLQGRFARSIRRDNIVSKEALMTPAPSTYTSFGEVSCRVHESSSRSPFSAKFGRYPRFNDDPFRAPGVGKYHLDRNLAGAVSSFGVSERTNINFPILRAESPGPCVHNINMSLARDRAPTLVMSRPNTSSKIRRLVLDLPRDSPQGPGRYDISPFRGSSSKICTSFGSSALYTFPASAVPGPGAYSNQISTAVTTKATARRPQSFSFGKAARVTAEPRCKMRMRG